jgi:hypothetical protein
MDAKHCSQFEHLRQIKPRLCVDLEFLTFSFADLQSHCHSTSELEYGLPYKYEHSRTVIRTMASNRRETEATPGTYQRGTSDNSFEYVLTAPVRNPLSSERIKNENAAEKDVRLVTLLFSISQRSGK